MSEILCACGAVRLWDASRSCGRGPDIHAYSKCALTKVEEVYRASPPAAQSREERCQAPSPAAEDEEPDGNAKRCEKPPDVCVPFVGDEPCSLCADWAEEQQAEHAQRVTDCLRSSSPASRDTGEET